MDWFRWHHGTSNDPKWRVIAKASGVHISIVLSIWASMLENASQNTKDRGALCGWECEDAAAAFDCDVTQVEAVYAAMQNRTLSGNRLTAFNDRNPKREDDSTERVQKHRAAKQGNAAKHNVTLDKIREEKSREEEKGNIPAAKLLMLEFPPRWAKYPRRLGRKDAQRHFLASVKTPDDLARFDKAQAFHLAYAAQQDPQFIQHGSTWFNNWQDWENGDIQSPASRARSPAGPPLCDRPELSAEFIAECEKDIARMESRS